MGKTKSNFKRSNKIIFNLSLLILILLFTNIIITINLIELRKQKDFEIYSIKNILSEIKKEYTDELGDVKHLSNNINNVENVENLIVNIKKDFFENAFKYEKMVL